MGTKMQQESKLEQKSSKNYVHDAKMVSQSQ